MDFIKEAGNKGHSSSDFDARAAAVLVQANTLGKMVNDSVDEAINPEEWCKLIYKVVDCVLLPD